MVTLHQLEEEGLVEEPKFIPPPFDDIAALGVHVEPGRVHRHARLGAARGRLLGAHLTKGERNRSPSRHFLDQGALVSIGYSSDCATNSSAYSRTVWNTPRVAEQWEYVGNILRVGLSQPGFEVGREAVGLFSRDHFRVDCYDFTVGNAPSGRSPGSAPRRHP